MHVETRLFYVFPKYLSVARNGFLTKPGPERKPQKKKQTLNIGFLEKPDVCYSTIYMNNISSSEIITIIIICEIIMINKGQIIMIIVIISR